MRILGIDPGTSLIGYGIIESSKSGWKALEFDKFETLKNLSSKDRVLGIYTFFDKLIKKFKPERLSIERLFFFKNNKTVMGVSEIRGVLLLVAAKNGIEIDEFTPLEVKQAVSSYGRADKKQVQQMVKLILGLDKEPRPDDVADALALAICSANTLRY
ncbi:MAG: crossover junction endodeoxyribonuclease RuvC [bacterium]|nr:crossover junction endodeoxyribonuclease RuvC [bacterium]